MKGKWTFATVLILGFLLALGVGLTQAQGPEPPGEVQPQGEAGVQAALGTAFTYQGRLTDGGSPAKGEYDFRFTLYDAATGGTQVGSVVGEENFVVTDGLFTVELDFGEGSFTGEARYLEIGVRPGDSGAVYTTLSPRQELTAVPYALSLRPGAWIVGEQAGANVIHIRNTSTVDFSSALGARATGNAGITTGVWGETSSPNGRGTYGKATATSGPAGGVVGRSFSPDGYGVVGYNTATSGPAYGVYGQSTSPDGYGVYGWASATSGLTSGVHGESSSSYYGRGVYGEASATSGTTYGVYGQSASPDGYGVYGLASATSGTNYGIYGFTNSSSGYAGYFWGDVHVAGNLSKTAGGFKIDHPLDPANQYLYHSFVESPDMLNIYNGNVVLDAEGEAWIQLPEWFEALNKDFRYQLTAIGSPAPNLYVAQEIQDNRFKIAGGAPGLKVSWQVTGIRNDPYAQQNRIPVEQPKPEEERGTYLYPQGSGQPEDMGLDYQHNALLDFAAPPVTDESP
jgi:hypothetical protein